MSNITISNHTIKVNALRKQSKPFTTQELLLPESCLPPLGRDAPITENPKQNKISFSPVNEQLFDVLDVIFAFCLILIFCGGYLFLTSIY